MQAVKQKSILHIERLFLYIKFSKTDVQFSKTANYFARNNKNNMQQSNKQPIKQFP